MRRPILSATFSAVLVMLPLSVLAAETVAEPERTVSEAPQPSKSPTPPTDARTPDDNLRTARKPDETPLDKIKILPSF